MTTATVVKLRYEVLKLTSFCLPADCLWWDAQDRSVVIARFCSGDMDGEQDGQKRSLAAVFDGHKRAEAAEIASEMLPPLLAKCAHDQVRVEVELLFTAPSLLRRWRSPVR